MRRPLKFPLFGGVLGSHKNERVTRQDGCIKQTVLAMHFVPEQKGQRRAKGLSSPMAIRYD
jgi:hypothetical protein